MEFLWNWGKEAGKEDGAYLKKMGGKIGDPCLLAT